MNSFVHLHVHSHYSLLEATSSISCLVVKAIKLGMPAIALTDHGNMFGIKEFYNYTKKRNGRIHSKLRDFEKLLQTENLSEIKSGQTKAEIAVCQQQIIKPIFGCEVCVTDNRRKLNSEKEEIDTYHLVLLAKNKKGYENLCKLVSISSMKGQNASRCINIKFLVKYSEGLIACFAGFEGEINKKIEIGNLLEAEKAILWYKQVFGDDFYIELQRHYSDKPNADNKAYYKQMVQGTLLLELAQKTNTKIVATNDVHFVNEEDGEVHVKFICLHSDKDLDDPSRMRYTQQEWLKSAEEMCQIFADLPEAIANTVEITNKVEFYDIDSELKLPKFQLPDSFGTEDKCRSLFTGNVLWTEFKDGNTYLHTYEKLARQRLESDYLSDLITEGGKFRYGGEFNAEQLNRIVFETNVIHRMGHAAYLLIVQEIVSAARKLNVYVGPGCGTVAGSLVAYCLRITNIDPLKQDLMFERFMPPDRYTMPNIELDFDEEGRKLIISWLETRYGKERVARIIGFGSMDTKSSIRDMSRVHGVPQHEADRLIKLIPEEFPKEADGYSPRVNIPNCIKRIPELRDALYSEHKCLSDSLKYAEKLEGTVRCTEVSRSGVVVCDEDLINRVPLCNAIDKETKEEILVTQYERASIEEVGLVALDIWGLKHLSILKEIVFLIKKQKSIDFDIDTIPMDDSKTYQLLSKGSNRGTFQFLSLKVQKELQNLQPTQFEELIAMYVICRSGLEQQLSSFINRKNGVEKIEYPFPEMEKVLKNSYGILLYQEQMMMLSRLLAGFTVGESLDLWRAMGKQLHDKKAALKVLFIRGCEKNGFGPRPKLEQIWNDWAVNAKYNCLKSYATCSAWIIYQTAYMEAHYPEEFKAAMSTYNRENQPAVGMCIDEYKYHLS